MVLRVVQFVNCMSLRDFGVHISPRPVRVVKQWFTIRTVREMDIIIETKNVYTRPRPVRLVKELLASVSVVELSIFRLRKLERICKFCTRWSCRV